MDSRTLGFAEEIRELTTGQGSTLILNSLIGQAIPESLSLLRKGGTFLEIGKNDLLSAEQAAQINEAARYFVIDLLQPFQDTPEAHAGALCINHSIACGRPHPTIASSLI